MADTDLNQFVADVLDGKIETNSPLVDKLKVKATNVVNLEKKRQQKLAELRQLGEAIVHGRGEVAMVAELVREEYMAPQESVPAPRAKRSRTKKKRTKR